MILEDQNYDRYQYRFLLFVSVVIIFYKLLSRIKYIHFIYSLIYGSIDSYTIKQLLICLARYIHLHR